jgi:hypothetical protein
MPFNQKCTISSAISDLVGAVTRDALGFQVKGGNFKVAVKPISPHISN